MNDLEKIKQLRKYKNLATGLFLLMLVVFVLTTYLQKSNEAHWIGYLRAFAEAAMVGALADWFAVTALFHYPLGLKIPHTNLIQNSKEKIGDNLGSFVVDNFLAPQNIRPYIAKLKVSRFLGDWLVRERNQEMLMTEGSKILLDILNKLDDKAVVGFIARKTKELAGEIQVNTIVSNGLDYLMQRKDHQKVISQVAHRIQLFIQQNQEMVRERVKKESYLLVPKFVDDAVADKITSGLVCYFDEIEKDDHHPLRIEISTQLSGFISELKYGEKWKTELDEIKENFLKEEKLMCYAEDIWKSIKKTLFAELADTYSPLKVYIKKNINELAENLTHDQAFQHKIDHWTRVNAYKYILKNTSKFGVLISTTIGNWEGKELSRKLELEVGKDLQFIRVNGTLVGGLVGLIIYTIAHFFI